MRRFGLWLVLAGATVVLASTSVSSAAVSSRSDAVGASVNFAGSWTVVDTCTSSGCAGEQFGVTMIISQKAGSSSFTGSWGPNTVVGSQSGLSTDFTESGSGYVGTFHVVMSADGSSFKGAYTDNQKGTGTTTATRQVAQPTASIAVAVSLAKNSAAVGGEVRAMVTVTAGGEDLTGVSLGQGLVSSSGSAVVTQQASGLSGFDLSAGASRAFGFIVKAVTVGSVELRVDASGTASSGDVHGSAEATLKVAAGVLSVADVTRGTAALSADVRVKLEDSSTDASGCDPNATYDFTDPQLSSVKEVGPCTYELAFDAPGTGIYHIALKATDSSGPAIPLSVDQYGATVDGQFNLIIDSCSKPEDDVPDVDALLNADDGLCAVAVGEWDSDAADVATKVLATAESSPTPGIDPVSVDSVDLRRTGPAAGALSFRARPGLKAWSSRARTLAGSHPEQKSHPR